MRHPWLRQYPRTDDNNLHIKFLGSITLFNTEVIWVRCDLIHPKGRIPYVPELAFGFKVVSRGEKGQESGFHGT